MQGDRAHTMHNQTHTQRPPCSRIFITSYFCLARWEWSGVENCVSKAPVRFVVLARETSRNEKGKENEDKTPCHPHRARPWLMFWWLNRGKKRENNENQARATGSDGFRALCSVKNNLMKKGVGERDTWWTMEGEKKCPCTWSTTKVLWQLHHQAEKI